MTTKTYTVTFHTPHLYAVEEVEADTAAEALQQAQALYAANPGGLDWCQYDGDCEPLEMVEVLSDDDDDTAEWHCEDTSLPVAAPELLEALELAVAALNTAPRFTVRVQGTRTDSYDIAAACDRAVAKAKGT